MTFYRPTLKPGCAVYQQKNWISEPESTHIKICCNSETFVGGTTQLGTQVPRLQRYYQNDGVFFSTDWKQRHERWEPYAYPQWLSGLQSKINSELGLECNSALINYYRDGNDTIMPHRDDQSIWGEDPTIVSLSFGATRSFLLEPVSYDANRPKSSKRRIGISTILRLGDGDLLIMSGETQKWYKHSVPREPACTTGRWNITFRHIREV